MEMAVASSTWDLTSVNNLSIISASCTGFAKQKDSNDFTFIVDLEWSDDRCQSVKRTFTDFQQFHSELARLFPELKQISKSRLSLRTSFRDFFTKDRQYLAETREPIIDNYLKNLFHQPERIRKSKTVLNFFEARHSDPRPCKTSSPSEKSDSGIDLTNDHPPIDQSADSQLPNEYCNSESDLSDRPNTSESEYESETETDDENMNEDYFLDVGYGELMLTSQLSVEEETAEASATSPVELTSPTQSDGHMWCSNLSKFSNILRSSMTNLQTLESRSMHHLGRLDSIEDEGLPINNNKQKDSNLFPSSEDVHENSETESQISPSQRSLTDSRSGPESDEDFTMKPLAKSNIRNYFLSTHDLYNA